MKRDANTALITQEPSAKKPATTTSGDLTLNFGQRIDPNRLTLGDSKIVKGSRNIEILLDGKGKWKMQFPYGYCRFGLSAFLKPEEGNNKPGQDSESTGELFDINKYDDIGKVPWHRVDYSVIVSFDERSMLQHPTFKNMPELIAEAKCAIENSEIFHRRISELIAQNLKQYDRPTSGKKKSFWEMFLADWKKVKKTAPPKDLTVDDLDAEGEMSLQYLVEDIIMDQINPLIRYVNKTSKKKQEQFEGYQINFGLKHDKGSTFGTFYDLKDRKISKEKLGQGFGIIPACTAPHITYSNLGDSTILYFQSATVTPGFTFDGYKPPSEGLTETQNQTKNKLLEQFGAELDGEQNSSTGGHVPPPQLDKPAVLELLHNKSKGETTSLAEICKYFGKPEKDLIPVLNEMIKEALIQDTMKNCNYEAI